MGLPNTERTAEAGKIAIINAIRAMGVKSKVEIEAWPEDLNTIAYEIKIYVGGNNKILKLTLKQMLAEALR
jgi:hypothetical protein